MNCILATIFVLLSLGATTVGPVPQQKFDPCSLLTNIEIKAVQGHAPVQNVPSEQPAGSFQFTQCFYRTAEFTSSVSVAVGIPLATDSKRSGPRQYWRQRFHGQMSRAADEEEKEAPGEKEKRPPKRIGGLGDEAFWVGDPKTGVLYVLKGEIFLRLSVGGPGDETQKIKRARALASQALKRLPASSPRSRS